MTYYFIFFINLTVTTVQAVKTLFRFNFPNMVPLHDYIGCRGVYFEG